MRVTVRLLSLCVLLSLASPALAQTTETAAVITEIKPGRGRVEAKPVGGDWRPARPLLALRAGDVVRTTENARAVIVLSGGRGNVQVEGAGDSFTVPALSSAGQGQKARELVEASLAFLAGTTTESSQAVLATRGAARPPAIVSPRNGPVLPDALAFEWLASHLARYDVRLIGPAGPVIEKREVTVARWEYPRDAPTLSPNVRYTLQVIGTGHRPQEAWFEVVDDTRARAVAEDLAGLDRELGGSVSPTSRAVLRAGLLARGGLFHDARRVVVAALATDRDEPTLHLLLGDLYVRTGLTDLAAESFDEARLLLSR
jgi:hypothetical protein